MTYPMRTTLAMSAARPPAYVAFPMHVVSRCLTEKKESDSTVEDVGGGEEVGADGQSNHGKGK